MSAGYASRLSHYPNKGKCGLPEIRDSSRSIKVKLDKLSNMVREAKYVVVLTGAGISTSAGIPDFRGPSGIWTLEEREKKKQKINDGTSLPKEPKLPCFSKARPTLTHVAITKLAALNIVKHCITQNVDGLHRRSGLPREKHSILHGCVFTEKCEKCHVEHFRSFDVGGVSCQKTGRKCTLTPNCDGDLRDTVLDWEDELPEPDYGIAQTHCEKSDLIICLGTSLRIEPAGSLPLLAKKFVVVNMQQTPKDTHAKLIIKADVDSVMRGLLERLDVDVDCNNIDSGR